MALSYLKSTSVHYSMERGMETTFNPDETILIPRPDQLKEKIKKIRKEGEKNFAVFTDFDFTLTKRMIDKTVKGDSTFNIVQQVRKKAKY